MNSGSAASPSDRPGFVHAASDVVIALVLVITVLALSVSLGVQMLVLKAHARMANLRQSLPIQVQQRDRLPRQFGA
jgi:hypothetical protein